MEKKKKRKGSKQASKQAMGVETREHARGKEI